MAAYIQANTKFYLKDILSSTAAAWSTFKISWDLELWNSIESGWVNTFVVLKNWTQIERFLLTMTWGVATIVKRGIQQDGTTANSILQKNWNDGTIGYITIKPDDFVATGKLDSVGWLRSWMTASAIMNTTAWGVEQASAMTVDWVFASNDEILKRTAWWTWWRTPFSAIQNTIVAWAAQDNIAGEALALNDLCVYEYMHASNLVGASGVGKYLQQKMGDVAGNTKLSMKIVWNGISQTTLKLGLGKVAWPTDNLVVRIETDDGTGKPSGTLANVNATANVAGTGLTTGIVITTVTFGWAFTLTNNTVYHLVLQRSASVDIINYYVISTITKNVRMLKINSHNGTSWQTESAVKTFYMIYGWAYSRYVVKANATYSELNWVDWINTLVVSAVGAAVALTREGITTGWSWLSEWVDYYLSTTPGLVTTTRSATAREVGYAVWTSKMYIKNPLYNPSNYEYSQSNFTYYLAEWVIQWGFLSNTFRIQARGKMQCSMSFSGWSGTMTVYNNDTLVVNNSWGATEFQVYPGDIVTCMFTPSTWSYGRWIGFQTILPPIAHVE